MSDGLQDALRLKGEVALVTGGAAGIGLAIAERLRKEGANVLISDLQESLGRSAASQRGMTFLLHDVRDEAHWVRVVDEVKRRYGQLSILVNNAGILGSTLECDVESTTLAMWRDIFAVNVEGVFLGCKNALPVMRQADHGSIINISSVAGLLATPFAAAYGASKAAVRQFTKSVAQHCVQEGLRIRCNSVHPGNVRTALWDRQATESARLRNQSIDELIAEGRAEIPMGDFTRPEDVAAAVAYLVSADARHVTGVELPVDGGIINCDTYHVVANTVGKSKSPEQTDKVKEPR
jgi:3(or 17)beta-hydroxysteroid dehydrogenase